MKNLMKDIKERLKSPVVLSTIVGQIALIVALYNVDVSKILKVAGTAIIEILTVFGLLNNPCNKDKF